MWTIINDVTKHKRNPNRENVRLIKDNVITERPLSVANLFNDHFASIGESSCAQLPTQGERSRAPPSSDSLPPSAVCAENSMYLAPVTEHEVRKIISQLPNKPSYGIDELPNNLVKICINELVYPLTELTNQSFNEECFPDKLKIAKIKPFLKKDGKKDNVNDYRPIALLPIFSKIIEKVITKRMYSFLEKYKLLNKNQFGFRKHHSTSLAVSNLYRTLSIIYKTNHMLSVFCWI
ncbi:hypothetical protein O0L34_g3187 [Tuta absoluta]|nr:hypothetical protein O0L34_g3187 [Tuta absoluta]